MLILGESHYRKDNKRFTPELNRELIDGQVTESGKYKKPYPFWTKIIKLVSPENPEKSLFWHSVAYTVYIQEFVGKVARVRPTNEMWNSAIEPFCSVVSILKPDVIIVLGKNLWEHLPCDNCNDIKGEMSSRYRRYELGGHPAVAVMVNHPSSFGFSYSKWQPRIQHGIKLAVANKSRPKGRSNS
jgi:hypothetical protein